MPGSEVIGIEEKKEIMDVLETGVLFRYNHDVQRKGIWKAREFEQEVVRYTGAKHALLCSSGSAAVALAMAAVRLGVGDEVIVPPFTYVATIEAVLNAGAIPVFAEIDETMCLSPEGIEAAITPRTKAVCLVHMCGALPKMDEIIAVCQKHNLILVEDSAQAMGAWYKGRSAGTFGKVGCYSLDFFKIITAGEGGVVLTNDTECYENAHMYSDHGHDHIGDNRGMEQHPVLGANYRTSELHAALALAQIRKIDYLLAQQRKHKQVLLDKVMANFPQIQLRHIPDDSGDSATFLSFFMPDEHSALTAHKALAANGISHNYWYINMYHYLRNWDHIKEMRTLSKLPIELYQVPQDYATLVLPKTEALMKRLISVQIRVTWTDEQLDVLCQKLNKIFAEALA